MVEMERGVLDLERGAVGRDGTVRDERNAAGHAKLPKAGPAYEINAAGESVRVARELQPAAQSGGVEGVGDEPSIALDLPLKRHARVHR